MKKTTGINLIKYGELHSYHPIRFETDLSIEKICEKISCSTILFTEEYHKESMKAMSASLAQTAERLNNSSEFNDIMYFKMPDIDTNKSCTCNSCDLPNPELRLEIEPTDSSLKMWFVNVELEKLEERAQQIEREFEQSDEFYGDNYQNSHERFLMLPLKVTLNNGETVWLFAILYIFSNKMGVLKLELPLINVDVQPLKSNNKDDYLSEIICSWNKDFSENTIMGIAQFYLKTLFKDIKVPFIKYNDDFYHIILVECDGTPDRMENLPIQLHEDLFRIICAPVPERSCTSYVNDAKKYLEKYSWNSHNVKYVIKTTGGCLSFIDRGLLKHASDITKEKLNCSVLDDSDYSYMCNNLARDLQINCELALLIVLLKKINQHNTILQKELLPEKLTKVQREYWENVKYICDLQEGCYGTVTEQIQAFEDMMPYYLNKKITEEKLFAIDNILED